jgi:hypothetical protein
MFTSIRIYKATVEKLDDELLGRIETEFAMILRSVDGFHAYRLIDSGNYSVASISFFETEAGANELVEKSKDWVNANLAHIVDGPPTVFVGEQVYSELV